jgi:DnaJ-domain-containing protein 1
MMLSLVMGVVVLVGALYFLRWYANAKTEDVKRTLRWTGIGVGLIVVAFLALTGRLGVALAFLTGLMAWAWRVFNIIQMGRQMGGMFKSFSRGFGGTATSQNSQVQSAYLRMILDHDTGHLDGEVIKGAFVGKQLAALTFDDLLKLSAEVRADAESAALLESFLDRAHPDWRARSHEAGSTPSAPTSSAMSEDEALLVLGLAKGAGPEEVKAAYRRLMTQLHPDRGGSDYLAAKINAAKAVLLKE